MIRIVRVNFDINDNIYYMFKSLVGNGNVASELKRYMEFVVSNKDEGTKKIFDLKKKLTELNDKIKRDEEAYKEFKKRSEHILTEKKAIEAQINTFELEERKKFDEDELEDRKRKKTEEILRDFEERERLQEGLRRIS